METIYIKKRIKTQDDLPKVNGFYIFGWNDGAELVLFDISINEDKESFLVYDWYLLPVELPTKEEIGKEVFDTYPDSYNMRLAFNMCANWLLNRLK